VLDCSWRYSTPITRQMPLLSVEHIRGPLFTEGLSAAAPDRDRSHRRARAPRAFSRFVSSRPAAGRRGPPQTPSPLRSSSRALRAQACPAAPGCRPGRWRRRRRSAPGGDSAGGLQGALERTGRHVGGARRHRGGGWGRAPALPPDTRPCPPHQANPMHPIQQATGLQQGPTEGIHTALDTRAGALGETVACRGSLAPALPPPGWRGGVAVPSRRGQI
jgi:hypothetical protein